MGPTHDAVCAADLLEARQAHAQPSRSLLRWKLPETHAHSRKHRSIRFVRPHCLQARWHDALRGACTYPRRRAKLEKKPGWRDPQTGIDPQHDVPVLAPARVGRADRGAQRASGGAHRTVLLRMDTQTRTGWRNTHMEAGVQLCCRHVLGRAWVHAGVRTRRRGSRRCHSVVALPCYARPACLRWKSSQE